MSCACILSPLLACIHCLLVRVFIPWFRFMQVPTYVHRLRQPIDWCSMNCFHACIHAHTYHHVHRTLYTVMFFFYDKFVVHMCIYTFNIACMYSLHTYSCIHCMFQCMQVPTYMCVHRLQQPIDVPLIVSMQVFMCILIKSDLFRHHISQKMNQGCLQYIMCIEHCTLYCWSCICFLAYYCWLCIAYTPCLAVTVWAYVCLHIMYLAYT